MVGVQRKLSELDPKQLEYLYKKVFGSDEGALVLEDLRNRCFCYISTVTGSEPFVVFRNEGMRSVILHIETQLKPDTDSLNKEA